MIPFNKASITELEKKYMEDALNTHLCGDGKFTRRATELLTSKLGIGHALITTSCSHALDMAGILLNIQAGDEVILPSYTFVSTANAFAVRGAQLVFCDVEPTTMNIDANKIEELITAKTKVIVPVHYAGSICDMDKINRIAANHHLAVVEDAAQAVGNTYKGKSAGALSDIGCFSFHETKNYVMGEGGAIVLKNKELMKQAEIVREKGTDRSLFLRGQVDKYTWRSIGSSYLPSDVLCAILTAQLERFDEIMARRLEKWNFYSRGLKELEDKGLLIRQTVPEYSTNNAHMYFFFVQTQEIRQRLLNYYKENGIMATFHYIPLHSSPMGQTFAFRETNLAVTEEFAARLIRLPLFYDLTQQEQEYIIQKTIEFFKE